VLKGPANRPLTFNAILSEFNPTSFRVHTFQLLRTGIETSDKAARQTFIGVIDSSLTPV
jgi:hypothetical protein